MSIISSSVNLNDVGRPSIGLLNSESASHDNFSGAKKQDSESRKRKAADPEIPTGPKELRNYFNHRECEKYSENIHREQEKIRESLKRKAADLEIQTDPKKRRIYLLSQLQQQLAEKEKKIGCWRKRPDEKC